VYKRQLDDNTFYCIMMPKPSFQWVFERVYT